MPSIADLQKQKDAHYQQSLTTFTAHVRSLTEYSTQMSEALGNIQKLLAANRESEAIERFMCTIGFLGAYIQQLVPMAVQPASVLWHHINCSASLIVLPPVEG